MKFLNVILILNIIVILLSCGTVKKAFTNQKKISGDEFLVEKKSPLVMPPDYDQLPIPQNEEKAIPAEDSEIKKLLVNSENKNQDSQSNTLQNENLEESILEKIKKN